MVFLKQTHPFSRDYHLSILAMKQNSSLQNCTYAEEIDMLKEIQNWHSDKSVTFKSILAIRLKEVSHVYAT